MTEQEQAVLQKLAEVWNEFLKLEQCHNDEVNDFRFHIHALQAMVLARPKIDQQWKITQSPPFRPLCSNILNHIAGI
jgi:hypothetical protein